MIFVVLELDPVVLTLGCILASFYYLYLLGLRSIGRWFKSYSNVHFSLLKDFKILNGSCGLFLCFGIMQNFTVYVGVYVEI